MNDVKLKSIILGINIILSLLSCKGDNIDYLTSTDNKSEITVKGGYNNGGDYIWNYNIKPKNKISQPKKISKYRRIIIIIFKLTKLFLVRQWFMIGAIICFRRMINPI